MNPVTTTLCPTDLAALRAAVLDTPGPIAIAGAGTAGDWAGALGPVDAVLETTGLTGVIAHNPGDMTVSVRAGTPLRDLVAELAPHGQHVSLDAARIADGATVGGLLATGDAGPSALVHGSLRDLVIGTTLVLADGTVAHSGGHVIKNVAGFDLTKLVHGSYGTLAVVAEVVLRLHPVPKASATLALDCLLADAAAHAQRVLDSPCEPVALEWTGTNAIEGALLVRIEGTPDAIDARADRLAALLTPAAAVRAAPTPAHLTPALLTPALLTPAHPAPAHPAPAHLAPDERSFRRIGSYESAARTGAEGPAPSRTPGWEAHAALVRGVPGAAVLRIGVLPSRLPELLGALPGVRGVTAGLGTGVATVSLDLAGVAAAHALVHAAGGTSVLRARPDGADLPGWGPPPSGVAVLAAVKRQLDPHNRFGPGRFDPWMATP